MLLDFPGVSDGKSPAYNAGDLGSIPGLGRFPGEGNGYPLQYSWGFPADSEGKETACNSGDLGLIPPWERYLGERKGYPRQYSCLENSMN